MSRILLISLVAYLLLLGSSSVGFASSSPDIGASDVEGDHEFAVEATHDLRGLDGSPRADAEGVDVDGEGPVVDYVRGLPCTVLDGWTFGPVCPGSAPRDGLCPDGELEMKPLFAREQKDDGTWTEWEMVASYSCPDGPDPSDELVAAVFHEWSTLTPSPTTATVQPAGGWVYANMPTIAMADDTAEDHTVTLLGARVDIRATPDTFTWVWGDGEETVTDDPGAPYPDQTLTHTYAHFEGDVTITLETTWSGEYRINNGAWTSFADTVTSHTPPINLEVRNPHSQLVACTTNGQCR